MLLSATAAVIYGEETEAVITAAVNNIAAAGGYPAALLVSATLPAETEEDKLRKLAEEVESACRRLGIQAAGGDTQITDQVQKPVLSITVTGYSNGSGPGRRPCIPGQEVVMSKWAGLQGTALAAAWREQELLLRFPPHLVEEAKGFSAFVSILKEAAVAAEHGAVRMHDVSRGGVFAALWELAEGMGLGLEIELKQIPIRQETIEICEVLKLNPYELYGSGALLMVCDHGGELVHKLEERGIPAAVIGRTTDNNDKVILRDGERRYLERPGREELEKIKQ